MSDHTDEGSASEPDPHRLEEVGDRIERARETARDALGDDEALFAESGTVGEELDDQTIAPPG